MDWYSFISCDPSLFYLVPQLQYKEQNYKATPVSVTPEIERARRNQEQLSAASRLFSFIFYLTLCIFIFFKMFSANLLNPPDIWILLCAFTH